MMDLCDRLTRGIHDHEKTFFEALTRLEDAELDQQRLRIDHIFMLARIVKRLRSKSTEEGTTTYSPGGKSYSKSRSQRKKAVTPPKVEPDELAVLLAGLDAAAKAKAARVIKRMSTKRPHRFGQPTLALV